MSEPAAHHASSGAHTGAPGSANGEPGARRYLCPYCGRVTADARKCESCGGRLDPLSRQATQNTMGPWQVHDPAQPFRPGCSFATVRKLVQKGQITRRTILRGPTTRQFWTFADRAPSVANLLGVCHNCHAEVSADTFLCAACGASFTPETDRQYLGLAPRRPLPGEAPADQVAHLASDGAGMPDEPRREGEGGRRVVRPEFPADPRPPRQKRSPLALIAVVAVAGLIGLSLGAAGALAVAWSVGLIDLAGVGDDGLAAPSQGPGEGPAAPGAPAAAPVDHEAAGAEEMGDSEDPDDEPGSAVEPAEPPGEPGDEGAAEPEGADGAPDGPESTDPALPVPAPAPAAADDPAPRPDPAPVVPPQLRRLP